MLPPPEICRIRDSSDTTVRYEPPVISLLKNGLANYYTKIVEYTTPYTDQEQNNKYNENRKEEQI